MSASNASSQTFPVVVTGLRKTYDSLVAVDNINFNLAEGSITALLGGNGAGKTTTIAMLLGLVEPTAGLIEVFGTDITRHRGRVAHRMNFVSPYVDMPMRLTVRQNLSVYCKLYGVVNVAERISEIGEELQMTELLKRTTGKLSAGQKTRVGLAKALLNAPELLLLDEPTASLDPDTADWVRGHLDAYRNVRGATIVLASHNMAEVERLADRVLMLESGRVVEDGPPADLLKKYKRRNLEDVFLDISRKRRRRTPVKEPAS